MGGRGLNPQPQPSILFLSQVPMTSQPRRPHNHNDPMICRKLQMESIDRIIFKRQSLFLFDNIMNPSPTTLPIKLMSRGHFNERMPGVLTFFNVSKYRIGYAFPINSAANLTKKRSQDWFLLTRERFKVELH